LLSGKAIERIEESSIKELVVTDSIPYPKDKPRCDKIHYLSAAPLFAEAIGRIYEEVSISTLFR
jgi:ribose-phosphate pyrophosphokinase